MKNYYLISIVIILITTITTFMASNNLIVTFVILLLSSLEFFVLIRKEMFCFLKKTYRYKQCYMFVNSFLISLSIKETILGAYQTAFESISPELVKQFDNIDNLDVNDRLNYLDKFFPYHIYQLFLQILNIYQEQGGDILRMSSHLLQTAREESEYLLKAEQINQKKTIEFGILWLLCFGIMMFLRIALYQFYDSLSSSLFYVIGIFAIMAFALFTFYLAFKRFSKIDIKGFTNGKN